MSNIEDFNARIAAAALACLDVEWVHQGRHREFGLDCIGLVTTSIREAGGTCWDSIDYPRRGDSDLLKRWLRDHARPLLDFKERRTGDIVLFGFGGAPYHTGILIEEAPRASILHCYQHRVSGDYGGKVMRQPLDGVLLKRYIGTWRITPPERTQ